jgi:hypothetical protein
VLIAFRFCTKQSNNFVKSVRLGGCWVLVKVTQYSDLNETLLNGCVVCGVQVPLSDAKSVRDSNTVPLSYILLRVTTSLFT